MRSPSRSARWLGLLAVAITLVGCGLAPRALGTHTPGHRAMTTSTTTNPPRAATPTAAAAPSTTTTTTAPPAAPVAVRVWATGNAQLDALLPTLPPVVFEGGANVHYGNNPLDTCCHAGGYNPGPNDVWIGPSAFTTPARLRYVVIHELGHSVHLRTTRSSALTAAVAGGPVVRPGPWDTSEKVADCIAWVLAPVETAASGITYWTCPDPWRSQVRVRAPVTPTR